MAENDGKEAIAALLHNYEIRQFIIDYLSAYCEYRLFPLRK